MRFIFATLLTLTLAAPAVAQSDAPRAGGAEFFGLKTYWAQKREGCQPMVSLKIKNTSSGGIGPIQFRMEVVDMDNKSVFASGSALVSSSDLPPGHAQEIAIGGDRDIMPRDCLGDMHEMAFSNIHFAIRLTATVGQDPVAVEIARDEPIKEERVPSQS
jgi:hypothetical protein